MIGSLDPRQKQVTVVGAGIAGLLAAYQLDRHGYEVTLIEASDRTGGLIATTRTPFGIAESAAHSILATPAVRALCEELGVALEPVRARARYVLRAQKLRRFPLSFGEALFAFWRAYLVLSDARTPPEAMTLEAWARRHLGEAPLRYLLTPFLRGIYGARPAELTIGAAFPALAVPRGHSLLSYQLYRFRKRLFSREPKKPRATMTAVGEGTEALVRALESCLQSRLGPRFRKGIAAHELPATGNVVLAVPAGAAAGLLEPVDPTSASALREVQYTPLVAATVFVQRGPGVPEPKGVGVLLPEGTERQCLGVLFNSSAFPGRVQDERTQQSLTVMLGGTSRPEMADLDDAKVRELVATELKEIFAIDPAAIRHIEVRKWNRAVPRYDAGLCRAWENVRTGWCSQQGHVLFGNYTGQVSIRGMIELAAGLQPHEGS